MPSLIGSVIAAPQSPWFMRQTALHDRRLRYARALRARASPLNVIQRQLDHEDLGVAAIYLQGIDNAEIVNTIHACRAPMMPATAGLRMRPYEPGR
jgi:hypothetical protein